MMTVRIVAVAIALTLAWVSHIVQRHLSGTSSD